MQKTENKIIIHACCGVCFAYPLLYLRELGYEPVVYFFNPNIYPMEEHERRYKELEKYCRVNGVELIKESFNHERFLSEVRGLENEPERGIRCQKCFYLRLLQTAKTAKKSDIFKMTTTLTVSPHKISSDIFKEGKKAQKETGIEFLEFDFKKKDGFKKTSKIACDFGMYRQNYCGCEFSFQKSPTGQKKSFRSV